MALEASNRLDPKFAETAIYINEGRGRRRALGLVSAWLDRLSIVPDARALVELAIGLSRGDSSGQAAAAARLERLASGRGELLRLRSPAAAHKLVVRLLLEEGRADEAIREAGGKRGLRDRSRSELAAQPLPSRRGADRPGDRCARSVGRFQPR